MRKSILLLSLLCACFTGIAQQENADTAACCEKITCFECCRADAAAPAGIMTDHVHPKGEFSVAYAFMMMNMHGNVSGSSAMSDEEIFKTYMMSPARMNMSMHMLMPMYGVTNRFTVMAMLGFVQNNMSMNMVPMQTMNMPGMTNADYNGMPSTASSSGLTDTKIYALCNLLGNCAHRLVVSAGVSLPTGKINEKGPTLQSDNDVLAYNMQTGTGTYNILPGLVYVGQTVHLSFGAAFTGNIKSGINPRGYAFGDEYMLSPWIAYKVFPWMSVSARPEFFSQGKLIGYDEAINQSSLNDPSANAANYGGQRASCFVGLNFYSDAGWMRGSRLLIEYGKPVYQYLGGVQMSMQSTLSIRLQYSFIKK